MKQEADEKSPEADEKSPEADEKSPEADEKSPAWQYRDRFPIQDKMVEVAKLSRQAAEAELVSLRKKLRKLQYGS